MGLISLFVLIGVGFLATISLRVVSKFLKQKRLGWLIGVYYVLLITSVLVLFILPKGNLLQYEATDEDYLNQEKIHQEFYEAAVKGRVEQVEGVQINKEWTFNFTEDKLRLNDPNEEYLGVMLIGERKTIDDGKIEITHYITKSVLNGVDITNERRPPKVYFEGNTLVLRQAEPFEVNFVRFKKDFTVSQFLGGNENIYEYSAGFGPSALYIKFPKSLEIDAKSPYSIQFVEKEK